MRACLCSWWLCGRPWVSVALSRPLCPPPPPTLPVQALGTSPAVKVHSVLYSASTKKLLVRLVDDGAADAIKVGGH